MEQPPDNRWRARPFAAAAVRGLALVVPLVVVVGLGVAASRAMRSPSGLADRVAWCAASLLASMFALMVAWRLARRLLPLATLLKLSLVFPDRAPSRFAIALRSGNLKRLRAWSIRQSREGFGPDAGQQAEIVLTLVAALNAHDRRTRGHSDRVRALTDLVARELGLADADVQRLRWAAMLHDVGKLAVPGDILNKPGAPDEREWRALRRHPAEGARLAQPLAAWMGDWVHAIAQHHERFDGGGYPAGLERDEIAFGARIVTVTDTFETMTAARSYKKPVSVRAARRELVECSGSHFDPQVVRAFLNVSLGRLYWTTGVVALAAQLPVMGTLLRVGARTAFSAGTSVPNAGAAVAAAAFTLGVVTVPLPGGPQHGREIEPGASAQAAAANALPAVEPRRQPTPPAPPSPATARPEPAAPASPPPQLGVVEDLADTTLGQLEPLLADAHPEQTVRQADLDPPLADQETVEQVMDVVEDLELP
jgi:putative nucleotidyltransferase with HDIG domain